MKSILSIILMGSLMAQDSYEIQHPKPIIPFELSYEEVADILSCEMLPGRIEVEFFIDKKGKVTDPEIKDSFNIRLNDVVLDKVRQSLYHPAMQGGEPIQVKFMLPILIK